MTPKQQELAREREIDEIVKKIARIDLGIKSLKEERLQLLFKKDGLEAEQRGVG